MIVHSTITLGFC